MIGSLSSTSIFIGIALPISAATSGSQPVSVSVIPGVVSVAPSTAPQIGIALI
jgi:hypothetical protein